MKNTYSSASYELIAVLMAEVYWQHSNPDISKYIQHIPYSYLSKGFCEFNTFSDLNTVIKKISIFFATPINSLNNISKLLFMNKQNI